MNVKAIIINVAIRMYVQYTHTCIPVCVCMYVHKYTNKDSHIAGIEVH